MPHENLNQSNTVTTKNNADLPHIPKAGQENKVRKVVAHENDGVQDLYVVTSVHVEQTDYHQQHTGDKLETQRPPETPAYEAYVQY